MATLRAFAKSATERLGYFVHRLGVPASSLRPVGRLRHFLEDIQARGFQARHLIDVGANKGHWTRTFRSVFPETATTLVEPQVELASDLNNLCRALPNTRWIQAGAGKSAGQLDLVVHPISECSSILLAPEDAGEHAWPRRKVPILTIDSLSNDGSGLPLPDVVKIDVEGFEIEVLLGAGDSLNHIQLIFVEVAFLQLRSGQPQLHEIAALLHERDFQPYDFSFFQRRQSDGALGVCEIAFVKRSNQLLSDQTFGW